MLEILEHRLVRTYSRSNVQAQVYIKSNALPDEPWEYLLHKRIIKYGGLPWSGGHRDQPAQLMRELDVIREAEQFFELEIAPTIIARYEPSGPAG